MPTRTATTNVTTDQRITGPIGDVAVEANCSPQIEHDLAFSATTFPHEQVLISFLAYEPGQVPLGFCL